MKAAKIISSKHNDRIDHNMNAEYKIKQNLLKEQLKQIILQRQNTKREQGAMSRLEDMENVKNQNALLDKLENDQLNNMRTYVKDRNTLLKESCKPNLAVTTKRQDKDFNSYVHKNMRTKEENDELMHNLSTSIRKQKLKETQDYQILQMDEKKNIKRMSLDQARSSGQGLSSINIGNLKQFDSSVKEKKAMRTNMIKKMLDDQIRSDQELKLKNLSIDGKEFALNAGRIRKLVEKY